MKRVWTLTEDSIGAVLRTELRDRAVRLALFLLIVSAAALLMPFAEFHDADGSVARNAHETSTMSTPAWVCTVQRGLPVGFENPPGAG